MTTLFRSGLAYVAFSLARAHVTRTLSFTQRLIACRCLSVSIAASGFSTLSLFSFDGHGGSGSPGTK